MESSAPEQLDRPVCPGCGEPWLRPTQLRADTAACTACAATSSCRSAPTAASTRRSSA